MNLALGCAFNLTHIFKKFNLKKLKINCNLCGKLIGTRHRDKLAEKIFKDSVKLILNDVIENNVTFELPLSGKVKADIHMRRFQGDDFKNLHRVGKFRDINFLKTYFSAYLLGFFMYGNRTPRVKNIYVDKQLRAKLTEKTNQGMLYC